MKRSGLDRVTLKYIAAVAMLIDHIGMFFFPVSTIVGCLCRVVGRLTCPIMCFFLAEGFSHTSSKKKYATRLALFAFLSQFAYTFAHTGTLLTPRFFQDLNMIFTLLISFLILWCYHSVRTPIFKCIVILLLGMISFLGDWGGFAPVMVFCFYICKEQKNKQALAFSMIAGVVAFSSVAFCVSQGYHWYGELWQLGLFLFLPFLYAYNGSGGSKRKFHKWFFYVFYPAHLVLLALIAALL